MTLTLITRPQLEIINRRTLKYPLQIAEKDYFLAVVLQIILESSLGEKVVFKGGTALNHCYLDQYRFSEDLDFSSSGKGVSIEDVRKTLEDFSFLSIKKDYISDATIKIERLQYTGALEHPNSIKVEIDYLQNVILPTPALKYNNVWGLDFKVNVMDIKEIAAEKIRAMSDRARYRDFYDLFWITEKYKLDLLEIINYVRQKEIREPITKTKILRNWDVVGTQRRKEMSQIYYSQEVDEDLIKKLIDELPFTEISSNKWL